MSGPLLFVSAGDPSGDNATSHLVACLKDTRPDLECFGLGGKRLRALGQQQLAEPNDLAVMGFGEVARRLLFFRKLINTCAEEIRRRRPGCVLLVDYPGFNLRLAERIKPLGIPVVYYISPQVWAWHGSRIHQIRRLVDRMLLILPFEKDLYDRNGIANELVGHYLLDDIPPEYISSPLPQSGQIALLPGSRKQEIQRMLRPMLLAAKRLNERLGLRAVVAGVRGGYTYDETIESSGAAAEVRFDDSRRVLYESDLVLTASGTATLETGIIGRPMVVVYKTGWLTYQIARRLVKLDMIGLVNLVLGRKTVPELIQGEADPDRMAQEAARIVEDASYRGEIKTSLDTVPKILGGPGASKRAAGCVSEYL